MICDPAWGGGDGRGRLGSGQIWGSWTYSAVSFVGVGVDGSGMGEKGEGGARVLV